MARPKSIVLFAALLSLVSASGPRRAAATTTYLNTTASPTCTGCVAFWPSGSIEFNWPYLTFDVQTLATVIYQVDTVYHTTLTTTKTVTATAVDGGAYSGAVVTDELSFWQSILSTTDVNVDNHLPTLTFKAHVYTDPGEYTLVTTILTTQQDYTNWMYLAATAPLQQTAATASCQTGVSSSEFGLKPTAGYDVPVNYNEWTSLLPLSILEECRVANWVAPATAVQAVSALTATTTEYGNFVASQDSKAGSVGTTPEPAKQTTSTKPSNGDQTSPKAGSSATPAPGASGGSPTLAQTNSPTTEPQGVVISGQTITAGAPAVTIAGTRISLATGGSLYVGSETFVAATASPIVTPGASTAGGYGSLIWSGLGGSETTIATASVAAYTGVAEKVHELNLRLVLFGVLIVVGSIW